MKIAHALLLVGTWHAAFGAILNLRGSSTTELLLSTGEDFTFGVNVSFVLNTGDDLTAEEQAFAEYCIRRAYNSNHDRNSALIKFAEILDENKAPMPMQTNQGSVWHERKCRPFNWAIGVAIIENANCAVQRFTID